MRKRNLYGAVKRGAAGTPDGVFEYIRGLEGDGGFIKALTHTSFVPMPTKIRHACDGPGLIRTAHFGGPMVAASRVWGLENGRIRIWRTALSGFFIYRTNCKKDVGLLKRKSAAMPGQITWDAGVGTVLQMLLEDDFRPGTGCVSADEFAGMFTDSVSDLDERG